ncbi:MAG: hypothetical protein U1E05_18525 [Patescibacteria group bacterium]|nr:hypothetical protein [Patescibacteria group bacterium]
MYKTTSTLLLGSRGCLAMLLCMATGASARADLLCVDFGATGQGVADGFVAFSQATNPGTNQETRQFTTSMGVAGTVDVTVSVDSNYALGFRNRGSGVGTLARLIEDHVKPNGSATASAEALYLDIAGLKAGVYEITTYHHDQAGNVGKVNVVLDDALGSGQGIVSNLQQTWGAQTPAEATFSFTADGMNPVRVTLQEVAGSHTVLEAALNGFTLQVPEPSCIATWLAGCLALLVISPRRARSFR